MKTHIYVSKFLNYRRNQPLKRTHTCSWWTTSCWESAARSGDTRACRMTSCERASQSSSHHNRLGRRRRASSWWQAPLSSGCPCSPRSTSARGAGGYEAKKSRGQQQRRPASFKPSPATEALLLTTSQHKELRLMFKRPCEVPHLSTNCNITVWVYTKALRPDNLLSWWKGWCIESYI